MFALVLLVSCTPISLDREEYFVVDEREYYLTIAGDPFRVTLADRRTEEAIPHLTYDITVTDVNGQQVLIDSRHMMQGQPYERDFDLPKGTYTVEVDITAGMEEIKHLHSTDGKLYVR